MLPAEFLDPYAKRGHVCQFPSHRQNVQGPKRARNADVRDCTGVPNFEELIFAAPQFWQDFIEIHPGAGEGGFKPSQF